MWHIAALPFELERGPLLRVYLQHYAHKQSRLVIVVHHIVSDGVSNGILFSELADFYAAVSSDAPSTVEDLEIQYADYAAWQREPERDTDLARSMQYWVEQLSGAPPALELATDRPRSAEQRFRGGWVWRRLAGERTEALRALGRENGCTLFMVMLGAFDVLLHRYSGQTDLLVGTPVAGRERVEFESLIGLFINTVVLRIDVGGDPRFVDLLERVRNATLDAQEHQRLPFEKLVEALRPDRTLSHAPIFQVMFNMTPIPDRKADVGGVEFSMGRLLDHGVSTFDLTLSIGERADGLELVYEYDSDLFDRDTVEQFASHYDNLLAAIVAEPDRNVSRLPVMNAAEVRALTAPRPAANSPRDDVLTRFEQHASNRPHACAVVAGSRQLSYSELDARANRLAHELLERGVERGSRIAVCLERSVDALTAILAVHKSGCAYVPIGFDQPAKRVDEMLRQAQPHAAVTRSRYAAAFAGNDSCNLVQLDLDGDSIASRPAARPGIALRPGDHAYVVFTSGSTGRPKGIAITHDNLSCMFEGWSSAYELQPSDRHLQMASLPFDVFTGDWVRALCSGATLVLCPKPVMLDPPALFDMLREHRITVAEFVPAVVRGLIRHVKYARESLAFMRLVIVGSDTWHGAECNELVRLAGPGVRVVNSYGVAEATIDSTWFDATAADALPPDGGVPIGAPFPNCSVYVCDDALRVLPLGVPGELCIGGAAVGAGYVDDPALTRERFVDDPFVPGARLYRTGDRARRLRDGSFELLGRLDRQVKLRGFRIEPGEIEAVVCAEPSVGECVVVVHEFAAGDKRLVAYVVPNTESLDATALAGRLREQLPDYMVPARFIVLTALPLSPNGKVDRGALPPPDRSVVAETSGTAPRDAVEMALAGLFAEVLGRSAVGVHASFFDLGGHSLPATQLIARIRDAFAAEVPLRALFDAPTVAGIAEALNHAIGATSEVAVPGLHEVQRPDALIPVSLMQQRLWFLSRLEPASSAYHLHWVGRLRGELNIDALSCAVGALVERHESLRTVFAEVDGVATQHVRDDFVAPVEIVAMQGEEDCVDRARSLLDRPFDLTTGPLLRVHVLQSGEREHVLVLVLHHIVADGWSMAVLFDELARAYNAYRAGRAPEWPALPVQYADYALWQRGWLA
ncbi:MAG: amino acid adenylation domain-containing protein, partial [Gammaproteobacteria bacterium]